MEHDDLPELMSVKETAEYLRSPQPSIYFLIKHGKIPAFRIGGRWKIKRKELDEMYGLSDESPLPSVLAVEDDAATQNFLMKTLNQCRVSHHVVDTGAEALTLASRRKFDLVLLDLKLPDMSGDELYEKLTDLQPDVPIVVVTAYPDSEILSKILDIGPVVVLKKPVEAKQLENLIGFLKSKNSQEAEQGVRA